MTMHTRASGAWKVVRYVYTRVSGSWKDVGQIFVKANGSWYPVWSYSWTVGSYGDCSVDCGGGTQTRSVTCDRNDGYTVDDSLCVKYVGSKPATSQSCNTQECTVCEYYTRLYSDPRYYWEQQVSAICGGNGGSDNYNSTIIYWNDSRIYYGERLGSSYTNGGYLYERGEQMSEGCDTTGWENTGESGGSYYIGHLYYTYEVCRTAV